MKATSLFRSPAVAGLLGVLLSCSHRSTPVSGGGGNTPYQEANNARHPGF